MGFSCPAFPYPHAVPVAIIWCFALLSPQYVVLGLVVAIFFGPHTAELIKLSYCITGSCAVEVRGHATSIQSTQRHILLSISLDFGMTHGILTASFTYSKGPTKVSAAGPYQRQFLFLGTAAPRRIASHSGQSRIAVNVIGGDEVGPAAALLNLNDHHVALRRIQDNTTDASVGHDPAIVLGVSVLQHLTDPVHSNRASLVENVLVLLSND